MDTIVKEWVKRVIRSCVNLRQLNNTLNLINNFRRSEYNLLESDVAELQQTFKEQKNQIMYRL